MKSRAGNNINARFPGKPHKLVTISSAAPWLTIQNRIATGSPKLNQLITYLSVLVQYWSCWVRARDRINPNMVMRISDS
jgi:hypothetical protein